MQISLTNQLAPEIVADAVVVAGFQDEPLAGQAAAVNAATGGVLERLAASKELTGRHAELVTLLAPHGVSCSQIVVVGLGRREEFDRGAAFRAMAAAAKSLAAKQRTRIAWCVDDWPAEYAESGVSGAMVGCQGQDLYRSERQLHPFAEMLWSGAAAAPLESGKVLGESLNLARELVNRPAGEIYPESFAARAEEVSREVGLECEVWDQQRLESERCGLLLGVAQGSARPPRLVIMRYRGGEAGREPLALVGKGVTFDSGGLSLKPTDGMKTMKCDMAGAAAVLGAMAAIARLKLPVNVIGLAGLVENMVGGNSFKLGDVLRARTGKTVEVLNTDAEGRLVLGDVLDVAIEQQAAQIVDVATLTGACMVALGTDVTGVMTNHQPWCDRVLAAAKACGEPAWQLPMFPEYREQIKSNVADIKNVGEGRWGGAITAAKFLEEFVQGKPWVHLDIAGPAFLESPKPWIDAGATGAALRTLVELARSV